jgi:hypothetical protein
MENDMLMPHAAPRYASSLAPHNLLNKSHFERRGSAAGCPDFSIVLRNQHIELRSGNIHVARARVANANPNPLAPAHYDDNHSAGG